MKFILMLLVTFLSGSALANGDVSKLTYLPGHPDLQQIGKTAGPKGNYETRWRGSVKLSGKVLVQFSRNGENEVIPEEGAAYFFPNADSLKDLPSANGFYPAQPKKVQIEDNAQVLLGRMFGKSAADKMVNSNSAQFEISVELTLSQFSTFVDCDQRGFMIKVKTIKQTDSNIKSAKKTTPIACR